MQATSLIVISALVGVCMCALLHWQPKSWGGDTVTDVTFTPTARLINYPGTQTPLTGAAPHAQTGQLPAPALFCQSVESELWGNCGLVYRSVPFCLVGGTCPPPVPHATSSRWVFTNLGCSNLQKRKKKKKKGAPAAGLYTVANRKVLYIFF